MALEVLFTACSTKSIPITMNASGSSPLTLMTRYFVAIISPERWICTTSGCQGILHFGGKEIQFGRHDDQRSASGFALLREFHSGHGIRNEFSHYFPAA